MWRFESIHSFGAVGNLYQKMHFAGSNLSTDPKCPKCIYKIPKNFRVEKSGEISRNLRFSRFFVPASKSDTHHGWDSWIRTSENARVKVWCLTAWLYPNIFMRPLLYHKLAWMSRRIFAFFDCAGEFTLLSSFCYEKNILFTQKPLSKC